MDFYIRSFYLFLVSFLSCSVNCKSNISFFIFDFSSQTSFSFSYNNNPATGMVHTLRRSLLFFRPHKAICISLKSCIFPANALMTLPYHVVSKGQGLFEGEVINSIQSCPWLLVLGSTSSCFVFSTENVIGMKSPVHPKCNRLSCLCQRTRYYPFHVIPRLKFLSFSIIFPWK